MTKTLLAKVVFQTSLLVFCSAFCRSAGFVNGIMQTKEHFRHFHSARHDFAVSHDAAARTLLQQQQASSGSREVLYTEVMIIGVDSISWAWLSLNESNSLVSDNSAIISQATVLPTSSAAHLCTFTAATCALLSMQSSCAGPAQPAAFLVPGGISDNDLQLASKQGRALSQPLYDSLLPLAAADSACRGSCSNFVLRISPNVTYQLLASNIGAAKDVADCAVSILMSAGTNDGPGCEAASAVLSAPVMQPALLYPAESAVGVARSVLTAEEQPSTFVVAAAVTNASCAFVAPQLPSTPASSYQLVTLSIIPVSAYAYLLALPDRTDADVANATISACDASQCNAALGAWLRVDELDPAEQYLIMQQPGSVKAGAANAQGLVGREVEVLVQALTAVACEILLVSPQAAGSANGGPNIVTIQSYAPVADAPAPVPSAAGAKNNAGAIAGGLVGGVAGLAILAAVAVILWQRRQPSTKRRKRGAKLTAVSELPGGIGDGDAIRRSSLQDDSNTTLADLLGTGSTLPRQQRGSRFQAVDLSRVPSSRVMTEQEDTAPELPGCMTGSSSGSHSNPAETSTLSHMAHYESAGLPAVGPTPASQLWQIDPATIRLSRLPDGQLWKLGEGGFGQVYKATIDEVREVAVKMNMSGQHANTRAFWREIQLIAELRDAHCLQFYGASLVQDGVLLVTEFCVNGDLFKAIHRAQHEADHLEGKFCWHRRGQRIMLDVAQGLSFLHHRKITHFDLKSPNVLLTRDYTAKIADVGLATSLASKTQLSGNVLRGSFAWCSPEVLMNKHVSSASDVFSYGVILYEVLTGEKPERGNLRPVRDTECPPAIAQLLADCLHDDPVSRPSAKGIVCIIQDSVQMRTHHSRSLPLMHDARTLAS